MRKFISSAIANMFGLFTEDEVKAEKYRTRNETTDEFYSRRREIQIGSIEVNVGRPFISVTNEWDNPLIGIVLGVQYVTAGNCPIAHVYDFITNQSVYCGNSRVPYTDLNLDAILKLNPYQRWNLISKSTTDMDKPKYNEDCFSPDEIRAILADRGFSKVVKELNGIQRTMDTPAMAKQVYQVLLSNNLNLEME